jgi:hypothetical protein
MWGQYFGEDSITLDDAVKKYKLSKSYIKELIKGRYIHASDLTQQGMGILIDFESQQKLKVLSENPEYRDKVLDFNPSHYYDYSTELINYHPFHDFIDRYCWLIKLYYSDKEDIKRKNYRIDTLFQNFLLKNKFSVEKLVRQFGSNGNNSKMIFHLQKGWYNELVRSTPLNDDFLKIGTKVKGSVADASSVSWNITQTYYSIYEYTNSLAFLFNETINTRQHRTPTNIFNNGALNKLKSSILFYPFFLSSQNTRPTKYPKHALFKYAAYPRNHRKKLQDINDDAVKSLKRLSKEYKGAPISLVDFLYEFRVWANYTGVDTVIKLRNGHLLEYLYKNLATINFFMGGISELAAIARLGEEEYMKLFRSFANDYVLKQPQFEQNVLIVPIFIRHRIYKHLGIISDELLDLSPMFRDPIKMVDLAAGTKVKNVFDPEPVINQLSGMKICEIAQFIINDWSKQGRVPKTYLEAMLKIESLDDMYGADPASSVVSYFIVNASQWKGDIAKVTKKYLSELLKKYNAQVK